VVGGIFAHAMRPRNGSGPADRTGHASPT
jgi:hypothetical protein